MVIPVLLLILYVSGQLHNPGTFSNRTLGFLLLSAFATGASWLAYFRALQLGPTSQVASIDKLSLVLVAIFAAVFLGESLSFRDWLGVGVMALGAIMLGLG